MRADAATDVMAIKVFETAQQRGQPVTIGLVRCVLAELESSRDDGDREAASKARATAVYFTVKVWQSSIEASRRKAWR